MSGRQKYDGAVERENHEIWQKKGVARNATPLPRIDLLRRFVSCCFFSVFFVYLLHPG